MCYLEAEVVAAMLYGYAAWLLRPEDFDSKGGAHHKLLTTKKWLK